MWWLALVVALSALAALTLLLQRGYRSRWLLERRVAELSALSQAGRAIVAAQLDVDALCTLIYHQARQIVDTQTFQLGLFQGHHYHIKVWVRRGERQPEAVFDLSKGEGIIGWMQRTGQPLLVRDFETQMETLPARPRYVSDDPPRSAIFVPLVAGEAVIGAMAIQSDRPAAFTPDHQRVLSIIANQAAAAIVNARMYQAERRRRQMADTLRQIATLTSSSLELDDVLNGILEGLGRLITYDAAAILLLGQDQTLTLQAARGMPELVQAVGQSWSVSQSQRLRRLSKTRQPQLFGPQDEMGPYHRLLDFAPDHSCLGAPILRQDELIGVLSADCQAPGQYDEEDKALIAALASQAASALENARLYAAEQEEAWISTALLEVSEATSLARGVDEVLETVVRITPLLVGVDRCAILLWDTDEEAWEVASAFATAEQETDLQAGQVISPTTWPLLDRLWESGSPVVDEFGAIPGAPSTQDIEMTLLALPLRAQGELIGVMVIGFVGQVSFSERRIQLIAGIANQAALAIESAQLALAQQEEAWVSLALLQVAEAVSSVNELDKVLAAVARLTPLLVGVERCLIYVWDAAQDSYLPGAAHGLNRPQRECFQATPIPAAEWPDHPDVQTPLAPGPPARVVDDLALEAPLTLPLLAWGDVMGALVVDLPNDGPPLGRRRLNILSGVAQQTATAVQNARLQVEAVERQKLEKELELARQIQASFLPREVPHVLGWDLAAYWQGARQVSGDFYDFVQLPDRDWGFVMADVADKGVPAALFMALSRTLVRTMAIGGHEPATVLARANDMIIADTHSDLFVTLFYAVLDPEQGLLTYANAGHNPPLLLDGRSGRVKTLAARGMAMGIVTGLELEQCEARIAPGDLLLFYTDGVTDALNGQTEEFGLDRLRRIVQAHRTEPATQVVSAVNRAVEEFVGDTPQFDDLTLLVLKRQT